MYSTSSKHSVYISLNSRSCFLTSSFPYAPTTRSVDSIESYLKDDFMWSVRLTPLWNSRVSVSSEVRSQRSEFIEKTNSPQCRRQLGICEHVAVFRPCTIKTVLYTMAFSSFPPLSCSPQSLFAHLVFMLYPEGKDSYVSELNTTHRRVLFIG